MARASWMHPPIEQAVWSGPRGGCGGVPESNMLVKATCLLGNWRLMVSKIDTKEEAPQAKGI